MATSDAGGPSDLELLNRAREGQWEAFEELVARFERRVLRVAERILQQRQDAEDATQQTFINVMENLEQFRGEASVGTWILRIAANQALTVLRKRRSSRLVQPVAGGSDSDEPLPPHPEFIAQWRDDPADLAHRSEVRRLIDEALAELDEKYRVVFQLRDVEQLSTRETAEILEISENNVKVRLLRARLQLRERLTRVLGDESTRVTPPTHDH
ncbi:MAG: sigma-70 family RNA polymerase sigma factor [Planctomycetes bacterium]|nr:sigma-70 family RNA polymerase sigma factor [Planctomycetota bacterium]